MPATDYGYQYRLALREAEQRRQRRRAWVNDDTVDLIAVGLILVYAVTVYPVIRGWRYLRSGR